MAVHTLLRWYREGADLDARLPVLATYLGHASIEGTEQYLHLTAELFPEVIVRSDHAFRDVHSAKERVMKRTDLSVHVTNFLTRYLAAQRNLSPNTIKAYRDVFTLLLRFGRDVRGIAVERLALAAVDVAFGEAFLGGARQSRRPACAEPGGLRSCRLVAFAIRDPPSQPLRRPRSVWLRLAP